jgi:hypothetical protein
MIDLRRLDRFRNAEIERLQSRGMPFPAADCGAFEIPSPDDGATILRIIAAKGMGWEHVSVSTETRTPTWSEMDLIYTMFFRPGEAAMQLHVPSTDHVNHMPFCLHLWRPCGLKKIPLPPSWMVGPDSAKGRARA